MSDIPLTKIVRNAFNDVCRDFSEAMQTREFKKTKTRMWARVNTNVIDVVTLYREGSSYGAPIGGTLDIRINSAARVPSDDREILALNGPQSDIARTRAGKYHLRFNAKSRHMYDRCLTDLIRFVDDECEPWFLEQRGAFDGDGKSIAINDQTRKELGLKVTNHTKTDGT